MEMDNVESKTLGSLESTRSAAHAVYRFLGMLPDLRKRYFQSQLILAALCTTFTSIRRREAYYKFIGKRYYQRLETTLIYVHFADKK